MRFEDKCIPVAQNKTPKIVTNDIKECLNPKELDPIEELKLDIRKLLINKGNKNDEIGKTRYIRPNLPSNIDPTFQTFGKTTSYSDHVCDTIHGEYINYVDADPIFELNRVPGKQTTRNYKEPFDKNLKFGKAFGVDNYGSRAKKILYWYKGSGDCEECDDELKQSYSLQTPILPKDMDPNYEGVAAQLKECTLNPKSFKRNLCIAHLNQLRRQIRKRDDQVDFFNIRRHFCCLNRKNNNPSSCLVSLDTFYDVLKLVKIAPDKEMFEYILNDLNLITENNEVYFPKALNLLNWRFEYPTLSKIQRLPDECLYYDSVYKKSMLPCEEVAGQLCAFQTALQPKDMDPDHLGVRKTIKECPINPTVFQQKLCIAHLNLVRLQIRKRGSQVDFDQLRKHIKCINLGKKHPNLLHLDKFYEILKSVKINPDREMFIFILKDLDLLSKSCEVCYDEALKVIDWRYKYPKLSFFKELPDECVNYETTYNEYMVPYGAQPVRRGKKREGSICFPEKSIAFGRTLDQ